MYLYDHLFVSINLLQIERKIATLHSRNIGLNRDICQKQLHLGKQLREIRRVKGKSNFPKVIPDHDCEGNSLQGPLSHPVGSKAASLHRETNNLGTVIPKEVV